MSEEKKLVVNCDICDARKVNEEELSQFSQIEIHTDYLLVDERSKAVLKRLPIEYHMDEMIQLEEGEEVGSVNSNGAFEITGDMPSSEKRFLCVNGKLVIRPGTEAVMKSFIRILVNGQVSYPDNMSAYLNRISVNGAIESYPGDYKRMEKEFVIDRYFPIRAKEGGKYYSESQMELTDSAVDTSVLVKKGVHFKTKELYVLEEKLEDCGTLFDEEVRFWVIPTGFGFVREGVALNQNLLEKYGNRLCIGGDLILGKKASEVLQYIEGLHVMGTMFLEEKQMEVLKQKDVSYKGVEIIKGEVIWKKGKASLDSKMISRSVDGVSMIGCGMVRIEEDVSNDEILEKVCLVNCGIVKCSQTQRGAVEMVERGVGLIQSRENEEVEEKKEETKAMETGVQVVHADWYVL